MVAGAHGNDVCTSQGASIGSVSFSFEVELDMKRSAALVLSAALGAGLVGLVGGSRAAAIGAGAAGAGSYDYT